MKQVIEFIFGGIILAAVVSGIIWLFVTAKAMKHAEIDALFDRCEYLGTRVETGIAIDRIAMFDCDGVREEITLR